MVHDLKNISAELDMLSSNARRHRDNPEFLDDAFDTVSTAAADINRLLEQLRSKCITPEKQVVVELETLIRDVLGKRRGLSPAPVFEGDGAGCSVVAEKARLANVIAHLVQNAQQATAADGEVNVKLAYRDSMCLVEIRDSGYGMDAEFIRERLFAPFDTTKGNAGMGIGMFESREFVRQLGGEIHIESEPGKGTLVALQFPADPGCQAG
jgi:putative PEP-CTERM system histidine kinase